MVCVIRGASFIAGAVLGSLAALADQPPPDASYRPLPVLPFDTVKANDEAAKPQVMQRQQAARTALRPVRPADPRAS